MHASSPRRAQIQAHLGRGLRALGLGALLLLATSGFRSGLTSVAAAWLEASIGQIDFGAQGRVSVAIARGKTDPALDQSWDTEIWLSDQQTGLATMFLLNPRRIFFVPLVLLATLVFAAPLPRRRQLIALAVGAAALLAHLLLFTALIVISTFSAEPNMTVYALGPVERTVLDLAMKALVNPPGNRFILPLFLALLVIAWQKAAEASATGPRPRAKAELNRGAAA